MKRSVINKIEELVEFSIQRRLLEAEVEEPQVDDSEDRKRDKQRVERFFNILDRSALRKYAVFKTPQEKAQAIIRFANMVGVPKSQLAKLFSNLRTSSKQPKED